jgi:hypothetical protein
MCVLLYGPWSNGYFVADAVLSSDHHMTYIINGVGHLRSDLVVSLVLWIVAYNIRGTDVVL